MESMPLILKQLKEAGQLASYKKFCKLIAEGKYPTKNIAWQLFLDTAEFFSCTYTSQMRYKYPDTVRYWKTFYRLFHGKGLRFASGPGGHGNIVSGMDQPGLCHPENSQINFAVPSRRNSVWARWLS